MKFEQIAFFSFGHICTLLRRWLTCASFFSFSLMLVIIAAAFPPRVVLADETSLYVYESSNRTYERPQVLIIFDISTSMNSIVKDVKPSFRDRDGRVGRNEQIYYTLDANEPLPNPSNSNERRFFTYGRNGCAKSADSLGKYGMFAGFLRHYAFSGKTGIWAELPSLSGEAIQLVDCFEDIQVKEYSNLTLPYGSGLPVDGQPVSNGEKAPYTLVDGNSSVTEKWEAQAKALNTGFGTGRPITLYTKEYLDWYHSDKQLVDRTRMDIGKEALTNVLVTTPGVDFGLAIFNRDSKSANMHGARIVRRIVESNPAATEKLINTIVPLKGSTTTPLCESLYEAYRYFAGEAVLFGDDDPTAKPKFDVEAFDANSVYISPLKRCQNRAYVVLVTDGLPANDDAADRLIKSLHGGQDVFTGRVTSYLSSLASWMNTYDVNRNIPGTQSVSTYAIGFGNSIGDAERLLKFTAEKGGGKYYDASEAGQLQQSLLQVFTNILEKSASFTAPSVASNNFNRIQTFESVYYAMFLPNRGPRWSGNLKKYKVTVKGDVVDANNQSVIDGDGNISRSACSHWSSSEICRQGDGSDVRVGGAAGMLQQLSATDRNILSDLDGLNPLTLSAATNKAGGEAALASYLGVSKDELSNQLNWARGVDVDDDDADGDRTEIRQDVMGDPLHSKPLAVNFGTESNPDIRVLVGTNHGMLHMFKDKGNSVSESWAYLPWEMLPKIAPLRDNLPSGIHSVYGVDGSPVVWIKNAPGELNRVWLFFGLRRGGNAYYGLDITDPDSPRFMWRIDASSPGMALMGQSWAKPVVTFIPGHETTPVLIFGAGYIPANKDITELGSSDTLGRGVFVVNAATGALIHSFGPERAGSMTQMPGIQDSIPNDVAILDSNNDGLTDRIYATDTGGNVWRMDIPGESPNDSEKPWSAFKFADLGGDSIASDRRFFAAPAVAQTAMNNTVEYDSIENGTPNKVISSQLIPYDAVVVGSGLRPAPHDMQREDMFFTLQDRNIGTHSFDGSTADKTPPAPLGIDDLYDVTQSPPLTKPENIEFSRKRGWFYNFSRMGEKTVSSGTIVKGRVFFTSYVPGQSGTAVNQCLIAGKGYLYGFDLHRGVRSYKSTYLEMGDSLPDTPQLVVPSTDAMYLIGIGKAADLMIKIPCDKNTEHCDGCPPGDEKCIGGGMRTDKVYYYAN